MRKIVFLLMIVCLLIPVTSAGAKEKPLYVYYAGPEGGVRTALTLDENIVFVTDPVQADVFVLNGNIPSADATAIRTRVEDGAGLVLILGSGLNAQEVGGLLGEEVVLEKLEEAISLTTGDDNPDSLLTAVLWNSAPQVRERFTITSGSLTPLVIGFEDNSLILGKTNLGSGQVLVMTAFLESDSTNHEFQLWPYFNYLIYHMTEKAAGRTPLSFADYPGSPVPHRMDLIVIISLLVLLMVTVGVAFWLVRRYSLAHPEALDAIVLNKEKYITKEAKTAWDEIGFHRPLGGFFVMLFMGLVMFVPAIIYGNLIVPVYILPSAQAIGIWGRVTQFFALLWSIFDMGTSYAFVKYLSEFRINDPRKGIMFGQVFVWYQVLSGAFQVALVVLLAGTVLPKTAYAIYSWSVIFHTLIQIPGFYRVMRHALVGLQRSDYAQIVDLGWGLVFQMVAQPIFVTIMLVWGKTHPVFGTTMSGLIGLGISAYAIEVMSFLLGLWLYKRIGYNARVYFMAHFDWGTVWKSFRFGVFQMLGGSLWFLGQAFEILITQARLINYSEVWGNWVLAQNFVGAYNAISCLYENLMPSISEAISHGKKILAQYYSAIGYKWGGLVSAMLASMLIAVADRFILGASGSQFVRAASYSTPLLLWGAILYASWFSDQIETGANKTWLVMTMIGVEEVIRISLAVLLLVKYQIIGLVVAIFIGVFTKIFVSYFVNNRVCFRLRFYFWQGLAAPVLAGLANYAILRWLTGLIWKGDQITSMLIFLIAVFLYPVYAFLYGLFGGWDDATLEEARRAASMAGIAKPMAWLFWASTALGARISPLHGRFPINIRPDAMTEARELEKERVSLVG